MGAKKNKKTRKRPRFYGNRFTALKEQEKGNKSNEKQGPADDRPNGGNSEANATKSQEETPRSSKRLRFDLEGNEENSATNDDYFLLMNFKLLKTIISTFGKCKECSTGELQVEDVLQMRMGFANKIKITCSNCCWKYSFFTSDTVSSSRGNHAGREYFESNVRVAVAFREIGRGFNSLENFARVLNICGMSSAAYEKMKDSVNNAYEKVANSSMSKAASEVHNMTDSKLLSDNSISLCECSLDGTWQKRGHNSLNGAVTAICNGYCIDKHVMSKYCRLCHKWESKKGTPEYEAWKATHVCNANHTKSSGSMEGNGAVAIFNSSVEKYNLIYSHYIGDGDTSSFKEVVDSKPYAKYNVTPIKLECVGHVQKRLGSRLRELRKSHKGTQTPLTGRGKLTDRVINTLQNYFGMAIRSNQGKEVYQMKKAVGAVLFHCTEFSDEATRHLLCPDGENSWCKWKKDLATGKNTYKKSINIPKWIYNLLRPIFEELSSDDLLSKCLHGKTQNANEALNNIIWQKCPKTTFVERQTLECAVNSAVIQFNEGPNGIHSVLEALGVKAGIVTTPSSNKRTYRRNKNINKKMSDKSKKRRKLLRGIKKGYIDKEKEQEGGDSYVSGGF